MVYERFYVGKGVFGAAGSRRVCSVHPRGLEIGAPLCVGG